MSRTANGVGPRCGDELAMDLKRVGDVQVLLSSMRRWSARLDLPTGSARRLELAVAEVAVNAVVHGGAGRCELRATADRLEAMISDEGRASSVFGPGLGEGLGVVERQTDGWEIELLERGGRRVRVWVKRRHDA